jgi:hypothetical protein
MPGVVATVGLLASLLASCGGGGPTPAEITRRLDAHIEKVFAGVVANDAAQLAADRQRVRDVHAIAALVEDYKTRTGRYPLVGPDGAMKNVVIAPWLPRHRNETTVDFDTFAGDLKAVLGAGLHIPFDPDNNAESEKVYVYSTLGTGYGVAAGLHHHVAFSERVMGDHVQYRVGSREDVVLPILEYGKLVAGTSTVPARKFTRHP